VQPDHARRVRRRGRQHDGVRRFLHAVCHKI
jgi:hypothetical protein